MEGICGAEKLNMVEPKVGSCVAKGVEEPVGRAYAEGGIGVGDSGVAVAVDEDVAAASKSISMNEETSDESSGGSSEE